GVDRVFSPEDGRKLGLQGMIDVILEGCDYSTLGEPSKHLDAAAVEALSCKTPGLVARLISARELPDHAPEAAAPPPLFRELIERVYPAADKRSPRAPIVGITGPGGAGKSSLTDEIVLRFLRDFESKTVAILSVDPTKKRTGGALLGDRIRMNAISS